MSTKYSYDRRAEATLDSVLHNAAKADDLVQQAYMALLSLKGGFDGMEEIPRDLIPYYNQTMKAMDASHQMRQDTYQLRMMVRKLVGRSWT